MIKTCKNCGKCSIISQTMHYADDLIAASRYDCTVTGDLKNTNDTCDSWIPAPRNNCRPIEYGHNKKIVVGGMVSYQHITDGFALFHQWTTESVELDTGAAHCPSAIIELLDGTVLVVLAKQIKFLDVED